MDRHAHPSMTTEIAKREQLLKEPSPPQVVPASRFRIQPSKRMGLAPSRRAVEVSRTAVFPGLARREGAVQADPSSARRGRSCSRFSRWLSSASSSGSSRDAVRWRFPIRSSLTSRSCRGRSFATGLSSRPIAWSPIRRNADARRCTSRGCRFRSPRCVRGSSISRSRFVVLLGMDARLRMSR